MREIKPLVWQLCQYSVSRYLSLDIERGGREGGTECDEFPQSSVCHLAAGKVWSHVQCHCPSSHHDETLLKNWTIYLFIKNNLLIAQLLNVQAILVYISDTVSPYIYIYIFVIFAFKWQVNTFLTYWDKVISFFTHDMHREDIIILINYSIYRVGLISIPHRTSPVGVACFSDWCLGSWIKKRMMDYQI